MTYSEYPLQEIGQGDYSWWWRWKRKNGKWGGFMIHRMASFRRGGVIRIRGYAGDLDSQPYLDVYMSDAGRSIRVYLNNREMVVKE